jgi:transposase
MKAYSQDLRQRVLRAIEQGKSQAEVAETFAISTATIKRYLKARRESGHVLPKAIPGVVVRQQENQVIIRARVEGTVREIAVPPDELVER